MASSYWLKESGVWKECTTYIKVLGAWEEASPNIKIAGVWRPTAPSATYATWNPADKSSLVTLSGGNLIANMTSAASNYFVRSTIGKSSGKHYWETIIDSATPIDDFFMPAGISQASENINDWMGLTAGVSFTFDGGQFYQNGGALTNPGAWTLGDVVGMCLDLTPGSENIKFKRNDVLMITVPIAAGTYYAGTGCFATIGQTTTNFGATPFTYTPPVGYNVGLYN